MATYHNFVRRTSESLICLDAVLETKTQGNQYPFAFDTGATHTVVDIKELIMLGYSMDQSIRKVEVMTANGIIWGHIFLIKNLSALGITRHNYEVMAYDFLQFGRFDEYTGMLGLDFFTNETFCVDTEQFLIWTETPEERMKNEKLKEKIELLEKQIALMQKLAE